MAKTVLKKSDNLNYCGYKLKGFGEQSAEKIAEKGLHLSGIKEEDLVKMEKWHQAKPLVALAIKQVTGVPLKRILQRLKVRVTTEISRYASHARVSLEKDQKQTKLFEKND